jgi:HAE1 family hydrophobic/amphiphilic exporter-1
MSIYGNAVRRPITTIMIFVGLMVMGIYSLNKLPIDFYRLPRHIGGHHL